MIYCCCCHYFMSSIIFLYKSLMYETLPVDFVTEIRAPLRAISLMRLDLILSGLFLQFLAYMYIYSFITPKCQDKKRCGFYYLILDVSFWFLPSLFLRSIFFLYLAQSYYAQRCSLHFLKNYKQYNNYDISTGKNRPSLPRLLF